MLLARLIAFFRDMKTFHIFLLEILAVFIGITASLFIDDWRQRRADNDMLDSFLAQHYYNAVVNESQLRIEMLFNRVALENTIDLLYGQTDALDDDEILRKVWMAIIDSGMRSAAPGYGNLPPSIHFNETVAKLDEIRSITQYLSADLANHLGVINDIQRELTTVAGLVYDFSFVPAAALNAASFEDWQALVQLLERGGEYLPATENRAVAKAALQNARVRELFQQLIQERMNAGGAYIALIGRDLEIMAAIRSRLPDVTVPVTEIGLVGSAGPLGWESSLAMERDPEDPFLWQTTVTLSDGAVKFRADDSWSSNWGAPLAGLDLYGGSSWSYLGDPNRVFPTGVAEFNGSNIPVHAGRYRVTFHLQTFEYAFEEIEND